MSEVTLYVYKSVFAMLQGRDWISDPAKSERVRSTFDEHSLLGRLSLCLFHCLDNFGMDPLSSGHDTKVLSKCPALTEIERLSASIADNAAGFLN